MVPLPLKIPTNVVNGALPNIFKFLIVMLVAPLDAFALPFQTTALVVPVLVLLIVKSFEFEPLFEPSIVT